MLKFKNPLVIKEDDTVGDVIIKGMTEGYIKGTLGAAVGLGVVAILIKNISKKGDSKKKEEKSEDEIEKRAGELVGQGAVTGEKVNDQLIKLVK